MSTKITKRTNRFGDLKTSQQSNDSKALATLVKQAQKNGSLNLSGRSMTTVPDMVWHLNTNAVDEPKSVSFSGNNDDAWWETVDLTKLILASNWLTEIPADIRQFTALTVLDVHDNQLETVSEAIGDCAELQRLHLSHNKLKCLPASLGKLAKLTVLHIDNNKISQITDGIGYLAALQDLNVSNNQLVSLPPSIGWLTCLSKLNVSQNKLTELPAEVGSLTNLRLLDVSRNRLRAVHDYLANLHKLEQLFLQQNCLTELPALTRCRSLKDLQLGNNLIEEIDGEMFAALSSVSILDLRDNRISVLPNEVGLLTSLERLTISNNGLSALPFVLGTLPNLKTLQLEGNPLRSIRRDIIMRGTVELKKYLRSRMSDGEIQKEVSKRQSQGDGKHTNQTLPDEVCTINRHEVHQLKTLDYSGKQLTTIPDDLWSEVADADVMTVNLSKNCLVTLPDGLKIARKVLKDLNISHNKLSRLSSDISLYPHLVALDLRNNCLSDLPREMTVLTRLREIIISFNRFREIPSVLYGVQKLEIIFINDNKIDRLDVTGLSRLKSLATLDLSNNNIANVPPELGNITWLRSLELSGNGFRNPRPAILSKGTQHILEYLRNKIS